MITVSRIKNEYDDYVGFWCDGHAGYYRSGKDIVCASVSSVSICTVNAIISINEKAIEVDKKEGELIININSFDDITSKLIDNMFRCFKELEKQYPNNVKIID